MCTAAVAGCKAVTRKGMRHLRRCERLLSLNLRGLPRLTDASLDQLHGMPLKELLLGGSSWAVTDEDVARSVSLGKRWYSVSQSK